MLITYHHCLFAEHHVADAVSVIAHTLVAIKPFDLPEVSVLLIKAKAPDAKPYRNEE